MDYNKALQQMAKPVQIKYTDFDSLFERFSIMTVDGNISDSVAIKVLSKISLPELINQLIQVINKHKWSNK